MTDDSLHTALRHHQAGHLAEAEQIYRQVLSRQPNEPNALFLLGSLAHQTGRSDLAIDLLQKAIAANPAVADYHNNLGGVLAAQNRMDEAANCFRRAVTLNPAHAKSHFNLGLALTALKQMPEACEAYAAAARLSPERLDFQCKFAETLREVGRLPEAIDAFRRAVAIDPNCGEAWNDLSVVLARQGAITQGLEACQKAVKLLPNSAAPFNNAGNMLRELGRLEEAITAYRRAIQLNPDYAEAHSNLAMALAWSGRAGDAISTHRRAVELDPVKPLLHSNLIFTMAFDPDVEAGEILAEARLWDQIHGHPARKSAQPHRNDPNPDRRLKLGYVSSDFRGHVVGWNLLPYLRRHDHSQFEIHCFSSAVRGQDAVTEQLRAHSDAWHDVTALDDAQLAEQIRGQAIDILVDLSLHTASNRLITFAMQPAPVQVTYLAYCGTSGMEAMHCRLSDPYIDPPDQDLSGYSEQTIRLPKTYWCYEPGGPAPEPSDPPSQTTGIITFGCLNQFAKASPAALEMWARILAHVPNSRMLIHAPMGIHLESALQIFARHQVAAERIEFVGRQLWEPYMRTYHRIDIALDPFPYNGGITTCDTLLMGVPVVTLSGKTSVGRGGCSILSNVGLPKLVAQTPQDYVRIAVDLAQDVPKRAGLRRTLRHRMQSSPLMDAPGFARDIESAFRQMWRTWCNSK